MLVESGTVWQQCEVSEGELGVGLMIVIRLTEGECYGCYDLTSKLCEGASDHIAAHDEEDGEDYCRLSPLRAELAGSSRVAAHF